MHTDPKSTGDASVTGATVRGLVGTERRWIEVTDMDARSVQRYVRHNVETDQVSLEHRGARTYLVVQR